MLLLNKTPFVAERYGVADENGADLLVVVMKGTYLFDENGGLKIPEKQKAIETADIYYGEPGESSIKYSSDYAPVKTGTDIGVIGHVYAPNGRARESFVSLQMGRMQKSIRVFGERFWKSSGRSPAISEPVPFERIPLMYERAFGGTDKSNPDPAKHEREPRNPIGLGFRAKESRTALEGSRLPNFENPEMLMKRPEDRPEPVGLGFISPSWEPRLAFAGTYDGAWEKSRMPLLPGDFNKRFYQASPPDLVHDGFLQGEKEIRIAGMSPKGTIRISLPDVRQTCAVDKRGSDIQQIEMKPYKLVIDTEARELSIVWGGSMRSREGFREIRIIECERTQEV